MVGWQRCLRSVLRQVNTMMERNGRSSAIGYDACTKLYSPAISSVTYSVIPEAELIERQICVIPEVEP